LTETLQKPKAFPYSKNAGCQLFKNIYLLTKQTNTTLLHYCP